MGEVIQILGEGLQLDTIDLSQCTELTRAGVSDLLHYTHPMKKKVNVKLPEHLKAAFEDEKTIGRFTLA